MEKHSDLIDQLAEQGDSKIVFLILDGIGGLHFDQGGRTELEEARTPELDQLMKRSSVGMGIPVGHGITPGSGPGHFALFGYDPVRANIGRGVLEASGIDFELTGRDVAVRGNFATVDAQGKITDRRAGRLSTEENVKICERLTKEVKVKGVDIFICPVKEHRLLVVFRGDGLGGHVGDTDPQETGVPPHRPEALDEQSRKTAEVADEFLRQVRQILKDEPKGNMVTLRGFAKHVPYPSLQERFKLNALCIANYPMYRGVSRLLSMDLHPVTSDLTGQIEALEENWSRYDFFFVHIKKTDKTGEDGDFKAKVASIEEVDAALPKILRLNPDVLVITGDHSTPSALRSHSWHPVPVLLFSPTCRLDPAERYTERECLRGALGQFETKYLMALALAHGRRLAKFGA